MMAKTTMVMTIRNVTYRLAALPNDWSPSSGRGVTHAAEAGAGLGTRATSHRQRPPTARSGEEPTFGSRCLPGKQAPRAMRKETRIATTAQDRPATPPKPKNAPIEKQDDDHDSESYHIRFSLRNGRPGRLWGLQPVDSVLFRIGVHNEFARNCFVPHIPIIVDNCLRFPANLVSLEGSIFLLLVLS